MSQRYKGAVISATPPTTSTTSAPGAWTLQQQMQAQGAGTWPFGGPFTYIEDVFSTYLYTGTGSQQTLTTGLNISGYGGASWFKVRNLAGEDPTLFNTSDQYGIGTNTTGYNTRDKSQFWSPSTTGMTIDSSNSANPFINQSGKNYVSWNFRKQAKFFDVVTYTGTGNNFNNIVSHSLGSLPGFVILKSTSTSDFWGVLARNNAGNYETLILNTTDSSYGNYDATNSGLTSTTFNPGKVWGNNTNASGQTYVAYLFAHNAGGFGSTNTDNVISCGSFTANGSGDATITLGYEPQWLLYKKTNAAGSWYIADNMRSGLLAAGASSYKALYPNNSNAEAGSYTIVPTATGFQMVGGDPDTFIYIAIRRGPMKTPTSGTSVLNLQTYTGDDSTRTLTTGFPVDLAIGSSLSSSAGNSATFSDRLRGTNRYMNTASSGSEVVGGNSLTGFDIQTGVGVNGPNNYVYNFGSIPYVLPALRRAPGFFDTVCYTGDSVNNRALNHNLGVAPELIIYKRRNVSADWVVMSSMFPNGGDALFLQSTSAISSNAYGAVPRPTATLFYVRDWGALNNVGDTYVSYLFATCAGVSKVGSYTGTGATQTVNCGFTGGARFVLIKRTDDVGDWFFWDTARGMVSGTDPYLLWNANGNQVTGTNYVFTTSVGFQIQSSAPVGINASGGSYIYLAIA